MKRTNNIILFTCLALMTYACRKEPVIVNNIRPLPKTCLESYKVMKTVLNWQVSSGNQGDTIYWQYDTNDRISSALQNQQAILSVHYFPNSLRPDMISCASQYDSFDMHFLDGKPDLVYFYDKLSGQRQKKEYAFQYSSSGELLLFNETSYTGDDRAINFWISHRDFDSVVFYRQPSGSGIPSPMPRLYVDFDYLYDLSDIPFMPFILSSPQMNSNFVNVMQGYPLATSISDAFIWHQLSPYMSRRLIGSYLAKGAQDGVISAGSSCNSAIFTYKVGDAEVVNLFN